MKKVSIDKCLGEDCICHKVKPVRVIRELNIQSISIDHGPSIFPGGGFTPPTTPTMAMAVRNIEELRLRRMMRQ